MFKPNGAIIAAIFLSGTAHAGVPAPPSVKPAISYASLVATTRDTETLRNALRAADERNWSEVRRLYRSAGDEAVSDLILWRLATGGETLAGFDILNTALARLDDWPQMRAVRSHAERSITGSALSNAQRIAWFDAAGGAVSGHGKLEYARLLRTLGQEQVAFDLVREAWVGHALTLADERQVLRLYGTRLSSDDYLARANFLLWGRQTSAASRLRGKLSAGQRKLLDARIALIAGRRGVDGKVAAVPAPLTNDAGLLYDRARWRRRRARNQSGATSLLVQIDGANVPPNGRDNLWDERNIAMRAALKAGQDQTAYRLAAPHGMSAGADFADAEWSAGWIALRLLDDPQLALSHFEALAGGVSTPISLSRAYYWQGRALDALNEADRADTAYKIAAVHNYAYYGQLAAEEVDQTDFVLASTREPTAAERDAFRERNIIKAMRMLGEAGEKPLFRRLSYHVDDQLATPTEQLLLAEIAVEYQSPDIGVRGGKAGLGRGVISPEAAYPVVSYPLRREVSVETALVLALSRQESELNPRAISHANARGLMQMLPRTARAQARREGLPYRTSWLTDDPGYNMTLGASHLDDLLGQFDGSYIMTAAAYNAGASRPRRWVRDYGDPRLGEIDPIDWVELIPFSETRNYVQRVLENVQVYRHRISGEPGKIRITQDLERGKQ